MRLLLHAGAETPMISVLVVDVRHVLEVVVGAVLLGPVELAVESHIQHLLSRTLPVAASEMPVR